MRTIRRSLILEASDFSPGSVHKPTSAITHIYFIASGAVEIERGETVRRLGAGEAFGQLRILNPDLEPSTVRTLAPCRFFRLPVSEFRKAVRVMEEWREVLEKDSD